MDESSNNSEGFSATVVKSIEGQKPSWKNWLSRKVAGEAAEKPKSPDRNTRLKQDTQMLALVVCLDEKDLYISQGMNENRGINTVDQLLSHPDAPEIADLATGVNNPLRKALGLSIKFHSQGKTDSAECHELENTPLINLIPPKDRQAALQYLKEHNLLDNGVNDRTVGELTQLYAYKMADHTITTLSKNMIRNGWGKTPPREQAADILFANVPFNEIQPAINKMQTKTLFNLALNAYQKSLQPKGN